MGDALHFVPRAEIARVLEASNDPVERATIFATAARLNALYMIARAGSGHIGSSFSSIDIISWLYLNELRISKDREAADVFFSSKGHDAPALYSVLIGLGLLPETMLDRLRRLDGLPGHPDVATPNIATNTGSLGMGISKAKGMIEADRRESLMRRYFVMTGDGELQEGQIWESLQGAANRKMRGLTAIVDHNKIQSDHWVRDTSDLGDLSAKFAAFGWRVLRCDGHNFTSLSEAIAAAADNASPTVIIADTVKGKGVPFMEPGTLGEREFYRFHSGAPSPEDYGRASAYLRDALERGAGTMGAAPIAIEARPRGTTVAVGAPARNESHRLIPAYADALLSAGKRHSKIIALDADLVLDCGVAPFRNAFPNRYIECGIAEQDMVSAAGGLSLRGQLPIVHSFACFLTPRANEQIYNNSTEHTKIIYVGSLAGLLPAAPGHSHQSLRDIALMASIPGMTVIEPGAASQVRQALDWMIDQAPGPCYLRLVSIPTAPTFDTDIAGEFVPGRGCEITAGDDAVCFAYGPVMLTEAVAAAQRLRQERDLGVRVINFPWLNKFDKDWLCQSIEGIRHIFTLDNHYLAGGLGERIAATIAELGLSGSLSIKRFGIDSVPICGTNDEALRYHRLDRGSLYDAIAGELAKA